jgi:hypothetical protein
MDLPTDKSYLGKEVDEYSGVPSGIMPPNLQAPDGRNLSENGHPVEKADNYDLKTRMERFEEM